MPALRDFYFILHRKHTGTLYTEENLGWERILNTHNTQNRIQKVIQPRGMKHYSISVGCVSNDGITVTDSSHCLIL